MSLLPVIERELRVRARLGTTYWVRCGLGAVVTLVGIQSTLVYASAGVAASVGAATFHTLSWLGFLLAWASVFVTADSISSERREGTLGLLFLTDLGRYDVVLGKLAAAGITAFYSLVGFVPALALVVLSGGVTGGEVARTALALLNALFVSLALGVCVSTRAQGHYQALRWAFFLSGLLFVWPSLEILATGGSRATPGLWFSPYGAFYLAPDAVYSTATWGFWVSLAIGHGTGWLLLSAASAFLARNWQELELPEAPHTKARFSYASRLTSHAPLEPPDGPDSPPSSTVPISNPILDTDPICWLAWRMPGRGALIWAGALLLVGSVVFHVLFNPSFTLWFESALDLLFSLGSAAAFAWLAGRFFFQARRDGKLELLLSTPLGARDIVEGHWRSVWWPLRGPLLLVAFVIFLGFVLTGARAAPAGPLVFLLPWALVNKVLDVVAVCWVGMWFGLRARKPSSTIAWTAGLVIAVPSVLRYLLLIVIDLSASWGVTAGLFLFLIWLVFYAVKNVFFIRWAAGKLRGELRTVAPLAVGEWLK